MLPVSLEGLWKNFLFYVLCVALFALGNRDFVSFSPSGVWVLLVEYVVFRRVRCLVQQWMHVLWEALDEFPHFLSCGELES